MHGAVCIGMRGDARLERLPLLTIEAAPPRLLEGDEPVVNYEPGTHCDTSRRAKLSQRSNNGGKTVAAKARRGVAHSPRAESSRRR